MSSECFGRGADRQLVGGLDRRGVAAAEVLGAQERLGQVLAEGRGVALGDLHDGLLAVDDVLFSLKDQLADGVLLGLQFLDLGVEGSVGVGEGGDVGHCCVPVSE